jgi:carboxypeptidase C (cathepsin A)
LGFFTEQGPFRMNRDYSLRLNEYAWNKISNMVFIESPCSVGFSYSSKKSDYTNSDMQTAKDNYDLIQAFFKRFPEYSSNDLYLSSESYGGHYIPTLAREIIEQNEHLLDSPNPNFFTLNLKGIAIGKTIYLS